MTERTWQSATITLPVDGVPLNIELKVPGWPVKPQVMLPILQQLANTLAELAEQKAAAAQQSVLCRKGCAACCRQAIPLSEVEIHFFALIVAQQPEPRRTELQRRFDAAATHFQDIGWLDSYSRCASEQEFKDLVRTYVAERVACPFLEDESCSIHPYRPIACREFLVTSDPLHCAADTDAEVRRLPVATTMMDRVARMARTRQLPGSKHFLPMVFALAWAQQYPESFPEKTGVAWLSEFCS